MQTQYFLALRPDHVGYEALTAHQEAVCEHLILHGIGARQNSSGPHLTVKAPFRLCQGKFSDEAALVAFVHRVVEQRAPDFYAMTLATGGMAHFPYGNALYLPMQRHRERPDDFEHVRRIGGHLRLELFKRGVDTGEHEGGVLHITVARLSDSSRITEALKVLEGLDHATLPDVTLAELVLYRKEAEHGWEPIECTSLHQH